MLIFFSEKGAQPCSPLFGSKLLPTFNHVQPPGFGCEFRRQTPLARLTSSLVSLPVAMPVYVPPSSEALDVFRTPSSSFPPGSVGKPWMSSAWRSMAWMAPGADRSVRCLVGRWWNRCDSGRAGRGWRFSPVLDDHEMLGNAMVFPLVVLPC